MNWKPPFYLFFAGYGTASDKSYRNDVSRDDPGNRRLLFTYTFSGKGTLYVKNKRMPVGKGDIFVIERPGPYIYCYEDTEEPWVFEFLSIKFTNIDGLLPPEFLENPIFNIDAHPDFLAQFNELLKLRCTPDYKPELIHSAKAYGFFLSYITIRTNPKGISSDVAAQLREYLLSNFSRTDISIAEYCQKLKYSHETGTRLFTKTYGMPPIKYLLGLRLREACSLLESSRLNIKEISENCGFSSQNYFRRIFHSAFAVTPGQYRKNPVLFMVKEEYMI